MNHELRTLLWLQGRLLRNAVRRRTTQDTGRVIGVVVLAAVFLPAALAVSVAAAVGLRLLEDADLSAGLIAVGFTLVVLMWLASPASNQQIVEPLRVSRLVAHPISFRNLVAGSMLVNSASLATLATMPLLLAVVVGTPRSLLHVLPIAAAATALLAVLIVLKALLDDILDLAAEDRRLRTLIVTLSVLPIILIYATQFAATTSFEERMVRIGVSDMRVVLGWVMWLPPAGWFGEAVRGAVTGAWDRFLLGFLGLAALAVAGAWLHVRLMRRIYFGDFLRSAGVQRVRVRPVRELRGLPLLGSQAGSDLLALLRKDWLNFRRSPMTGRLIFLPFVMAFAAFALAGVGMPTPAVGLLMGGMAAFMTTMLAHNQIATYDHAGVGALLLSPAPRALVLLSNAILNLAVALGLGLLAGVVTWMRSGEVLALLIAAGSAVLMQMPLNGLTHLTSLFFPYLVDLERGSAAANETRQSFFTVFSAMFGLPLLVGPMLLPALLAWAAAPQLLPLAVLFAFVYAPAAYAALLYLATRAFPWREETLFERIVSQR